MAPRTPAALLAALLLCLVPLQAAQKAPVALENRLLRVYVTHDGASLDSAYVKPFGAGVSGCRVAEPAVFIDGRKVPLTGYKVLKSAADRVSFQTFLPANPLIGERPAANDDPPYYPDDPTDRLRITKEYVLSDAAPPCRSRLIPPPTPATSLGR